MIADQGQQCNDHKLPSEVNKIFRSPCNNWLWATAGEAIIGQKLRRHLKVDSDVVDQVSQILADHKSDGVIALGLSRTRALVRVDCQGYVTFISEKVDYYAIGLADTEAMAFLSGWEARGDKVAVGQGVEALMYSHSIYPVIDTAHTIMTFG
jgi:hypothetical protein